MDGRGILEIMLASLHCPARISTLSLRGPGLSIYQRGRRPSLRMGREGMGGDIKSVLLFSSYFVHIQNMCICTYIDDKNCHQHSYGFQNLM